MASIVTNGRLYLDHIRHPVLLILSHQDNTMLMNIFMPIRVAKLAAVEDTVEKNNLTNVTGRAIVIITNAEVVETDQKDVSVF